MKADRFFSSHTKGELPAGKKLKGEFMKELDVVESYEREGTYLHRDRFRGHGCPFARAKKMPRKQTNTGTRGEDDRAPKKKAVSNGRNSLISHTPAWGSLMGTKGRIQGERVQDSPLQWQRGGVALTTRRTKVPREWLKKTTQK